MNRWAKARLRQVIKEVKAGLRPAPKRDDNRPRLAGTLTLFRTAAPAA